MTRPLALLTALLLLAGTASGQVAQADLDALFQQFDTTYGPGCAVATSLGGEPDLARAYGMADLEHGVINTPETVFEPGSVSKQITAAATVLLALDGALSLDDDIRTYIPEVPDYGTPITIRHLLNHTSGLRDWGAVAAIEGWPRTTRVHTHTHMLDIVSRQKELNYTPGEFYSYTNTGYNLQAVLVERVSGMSLAEFSRVRIFEPLGMTRTEWRDDYRRVVPDRAVAYSEEDGAWVMDMPFENVYGNGGLLTTVGDLLKFTRNLETGELGGPSFIEEMHRKGVLTSGDEITYASGLVVSSYRGVREVSHSGATAGYRGYLSRYPESGLAVAVMCNLGNVNPTRLAHNVVDLYLGDALQAIEPPAPRPAPEPAAAAWQPSADDLAPYAGSYHSDEAEVTYLVRLVSGSLVVEDRYGQTVELEPVRQDDFSSDAGDISFVTAEGSISGFRLSQPRVWSLLFERVR